jgi:hypothetical protein
MAGAGDWTGDGTNDILAGSFHPWDEENPSPLPSSVALYSGSSTPSCPTSASHLLINPYPGQNGDRFGWSVAYIGDIDADGRTDFAVGAPRGPKSGISYEQRGTVFVFLSSLMSQTSGVITAQCASLIIRGAAANDRFGYAMDRAGDHLELHPIGTLDFAVGAPGNDLGGTPGRVYIISGSAVLGAATSHGCTTDPPSVAVTDLAGTLVVNGTAANDGFGYSVAFAGDTLGDGTANDLVVGAPQFYWDSDPVLGLTFKYLGPGYARLLRGPGAVQAFTVYGEIQSLQSPGSEQSLDASFGLSVTGWVDLDADGRDDIAVGAPRMDDESCGASSCAISDAGRVYIYSGLTGQLLLTRTGATTENFGNSVAGLGDLNNDGQDYLAVGSRTFGTQPYDGACTTCTPPADPVAGGRGCGRAYFFKGLTPAVCFTITGEDAKDSLGWAFARVGDLGGSICHEIVTSGMRWGPTGVQAEVGRVYVMVR